VAEVAEGINGVVDSPSNTAFSSMLPQMFAIWLARTIRSVAVAFCLNNLETTKEAYRTAVDLITLLAGTSLRTTALKRPVVEELLWPQALSGSPSVVPMLLDLLSHIQ
jgi:hypothetical protein